MSDHDQAGSSAMAKNKENEHVTLLKLQFKEICDVTDEVAETFLRESGWDLESAIHQYFYSQNPEPEAIENQDNERQELRHRLQPPGPQQPGRIPLNDPFQANAGPIRRPTTWMQWFHSLVLLPFQYFYYTFAEIFRFFYTFFLGPPRPRRRIAAPTIQRNATADRQLMQEQESDYARSLAHDRARREEERKRETERQEHERARREEEKHAAARKNRLESMRNTIREELAIAEAPTGPGTVRVRINFPSGIGFERCFSSDDSLQMLFKAVFVHECCPENFTLLSSYPRRVLNCAPEWYSEFGTIEDPTSIRTFAQESLVNSVAVLVRDNDA